MYTPSPHMFTSLGRSHSHGFLPDVDAPISYFSNPIIPIENEMEERQRLEREKQKLLFGSTMDSHSPIQSYSKPTDVTRINHNSAFDGLCVPFGGSHDLYEDPWASRKKQDTFQEWPIDTYPQQTPELMKQNSNNVYPFHTDAASSLVFPVDAPQHHHDISPSSTLEEPTTPASFMMSDSEEDDIMPSSHKRQRGEHHTIYIKQEPEDQDIPLPPLDVSYQQSPPQQPFVNYTQQQQHQQTYNMQPTYMLPFTLQPQEQAPVYANVLSLPSITTTSPVTTSRRSSMSDSDSEDDGKRKRKAPSTSTKRKSQPIGTHVIENTGAPVKMAKYLHVDGMTTRVWIEHATYEENGVTTDVRLIMYSGAFNGVVVHAGDVGERIVCNRRSNISREFGQYASPTEKILIRVPSEHRPLGQTGNVLTGFGLIRFMQSKKMRKPENQRYRRWLLHHVYQILQARPFTFPKGHALETATIPSTPFTEADFSH